MTLDPRLGPGIEAEHLVVGRRYRVQWNDCCTAGEFEAVLTDMVWVDDSPEPEPFLDALVFDNGVRLTDSLWGPRFEEAAA